MGFWTFINGLKLLRYPELVQDLGERRFYLRTINQIRERFPDAKIDRDLRLIGYAEDLLRLGGGVTLSAGTVLAFGDEHNGISRITIGSGTWIGQYNNLRASRDAEIRIGAGCLVSQFCTLVGTNHSICRDQPIAAQGPDLSRRGIVIEDDVWLGAGSVVLPGVTIRQGAVVGANAVVTRDVPDFEIWGGVPATRIGVRE